VRARVGEWARKKRNGQEAKQYNQSRREREGKKYTDGPIAGDACHV